MPLDKDGSEIPDPTPLTIPSGFRRPETLAEQVQRLVRTHVSRQAQLEGNESFEESEDFDVPDDSPDPSTPFEEVFDPTLGRAITPAEFAAFERIYRDRALKRTVGAFDAEDRLEQLRAGPRRSRKGGGEADTKTPPSETKSE